MKKNNLFKCEHGNLLRGEDMRAVLISIQPKWCELIAKGKKTVEVRKTRPKIKTPFKVYIYCTQARMPIKDEEGRILLYEDDLAITNRYGQDKKIENPQGELLLNGKVIGEFVCDEIYSDNQFNVKTSELLDNACLTLFDIAKYLKPMQVAHFWHISNLIVYDKPKELSEFYKYTEYDDSKNDIRPCNVCERNKFDSSEMCEYCEIDFVGEHCIHLQMTRPPQSWCYVEELR